MNPTNTQMIIATADFNGISPSVVHEVSENEMYVGYCLPDTISYDEPRWLIKRIMKTTVDGMAGTLQTIKYAKGSRKFDLKWSGHENYSYSF